MPHLWVRAEQRPNEDRTGLTPDGATHLLAQGFEISVETSANRVFPDADYAAAGCGMVAPHSWPDAPRDALIFGLKELPDDGTPLVHRHIMFGHAFKGQHAGQRLLRRFRAGGGTLYDLEYLVDDSGRRLAAFGYWAGYAGAAISLFAWASQTGGTACPAVSVYAGETALLAALAAAFGDNGASAPRVIIIGALGRVGTGAAKLCQAMGSEVTGWDIPETARGGPFPEILTHDVFLNCILARPETPVFVPQAALDAPRALRVIGDIACDPDSAYNPIPIYHATTSWDAPVTRVCDTPVLDVMAIDNLPSILPRESSLDFAAQLLPVLTTLADVDVGAWGRARTTFETHMKELETT
ncbi:MAG: saccharopine dehydrogenase [Pseudomonadota bacterium]